MRALVLCRLEPGLDDAALVGALDRIGVETMFLDDEKVAYPRWDGSIFLRVARRLVRGEARRTFNQRLCQMADFMRPDALIVFGGAGLERSSVQYCQSLGAKIYFIYPDTTVNLPRVYTELWNDAHSFTTKPNWNALANLLGVNGAPTFLYPWYDPQFRADYPADKDQLSNDILFVGHASEAKRKAIEAVAETFRDRFRMTVVGNGWSKLPQHVVNSGSGMYGGFVNSLYAKSAVTLGLLEDLGAGVHDVITARTIQVPAYGGCLIHPRNSGSQALFGPAEFLFENTSDHSELLDRVSIALSDHAKRKTWAAAQWQAVRPHSVDSALETILNPTRGTP